MLVVKKWWVIAVVFTLALSLTSCARKKATLSGVLYTRCSGAGGEWDGYGQVNGDTIDARFIPVALTINGPFKIALGNGSGGYRVLTGSVNPALNDQVPAIIYSNDYNAYDRIIIAPDDGLEFGQGNSADDVVCPMMEQQQN